jgi:hypothetical protein
MAETSHPYATLPPDAFWRSAVAERDALDVTGLWKPKFPISTDMRIVTAGSCFAQHISRAVQERGFNWYNAETAPGSAELARSFNYGVFSFRTGNIYTTRMLNQWFRWARKPDDCPDIYWTSDRGIQDPFRPNIEPDGFATLEEARASRRAVLAAVGDAMRKAEIFVFTLGLTECWRSADGLIEFAACPGTSAGCFDPAEHVFHNMGFKDVTRELSRALANLRAVNKRVKILLTVSPVPLTATASGQHVLTATSHSKAILRAAAGTIAAEHDDVDYFPSYEIITHPVWGGRFYAENKRSVRPEGVAFVMNQFFAAIGAEATGVPKQEPQHRPLAPDDDDLICEEEMLAAFAPQTARGGS